MRSRPTWIDRESESISVTSVSTFSIESEETKVVQDAPLCGKSRADVALSLVYY